MAILKWCAPQYDGGAVLTGYELRMLEVSASSSSSEAADLGATIINSNSNNSDYSMDAAPIVYRGGTETTCIVSGLLPGRRYRLELRAFNRAGASALWSNAFEFQSGAGAPDQPLAPSVTAKSPQCLLIAWNEPNGNGAACTDYRLEWAEKPQPQQQQTTTTTAFSDSCSAILFAQLYTGSALRYELRGGFSATTRYLFRVQAANGHGSSAFSAFSDFLTPANVPGPVAGVRVDELTAGSALIAWKPAVANGSPVLAYQIDFAEAASLATPAATTAPSSGGNSYIVVDCSQAGEDAQYEHRVSGLQADTAYRVRVQAVNAVGAGQFSASVKIRTRCLPPLPPALIEFVSAGYNNIKVKGMFAQSRVRLYYNVFYEVI